MAVNYHHARNLHTEDGPRAALPVMFGMDRPASLLDVGCGAGTWLKAAGEYGVRDVFGVDGVDIPRERLLVDEGKFLVQDLTTRWALGRRFDVALCLEVAEHLEAAHASNVVDALTRHADLVFFSAACPGQPGQHHVNCQWPAYWQRLFNDAGYSCSDAVRWAIWDIDVIEPWYRQNMFVARRDTSGAGREPRIKAAIHPDLLGYLAAEYRRTEIETGHMPPQWYMSTSAKALFRKVRRKLTGVGSAR